MGEKTRSDTELLEQFLATRDPALREELILRHVSLVNFVLGRLGVTRGRSAEYDDLESQGLLGLIDAIDHFKPEFGTRLSTYATLKIRSRVLDYLREMDWLSRSARQRVRAVQEAMVTLENQLHRLPTDEELTEYLQIDMDTLQQALQDSSHTVVSLDDTMFDMVGEDGASLHEKLKDDKQIDPSEGYEVDDMQKNLIKAIKYLPDREQLVLSLYYYEELTFKEIGKALDISESRVCQIHGRAMMNLKSLLETGEYKRETKNPTPGALTGVPVQQ